MRTSSVTRFGAVVGAVLAAVSLVACSGADPVAPAAPGDGSNAGCAANVGGCDQPGSSDDQPGSGSGGQPGASGGQPGSGTDGDSGGGGEQPGSGGDDGGAPTPVVDGAAPTDPPVTASPDGGAPTGSLNPNVAPGGNFDLTKWQLQLPIGSTGAPKFVAGAQLAGANGFTNIYFYTDKSDGAMTFMDPTTGVTTSGSQHPRSELREVTAGWPTTGTNTETVTVSVPKVPTTVTIGQIFQAAPAPSKPLMELEYSKGGKLRLLLENTNQGGASTFHDVGTVTDGAKFTYVLSLTGTTITVKVNATTSTFTLPPTFVGESFYFKCGNYDQTAVAGTPGTTPGTLVKIYDVKIVHR